MGKLEDLANGVQLALDSTLARLEQDEDELIRLIDSATPQELAQALAYLADAYQDSLVAQLGDNRELAIETFKRVRANGGATDDVMRAQLRAMELRPDDDL